MNPRAVRNGLVAALPFWALIYGLLALVEVVV